LILTPQNRKIATIVLAVACFVIAALLFIAFFEQIPVEGTMLAVDWNGLWGAIAGGEIRYENHRGFRLPPWDALLVLPLGLLPLRASWGLITFITMTVLVVSVPRTERRRLYWLSILLLVTSFPSLRHAADGNFEALVIGGVLLAVYGYQKQQPFILTAGVLLAVAKPQETVLLVAVIGIYVLQTFPRPVLLKTAGLLAVVVVPLMLWRGGDWITTMLEITQRGSIMDVSLMAALNRTTLLSSIGVGGVWLGFLVATLAIAWKSDRTFSREKAAMLVAASLLIAPYSAGNSVLTVLAVGVIPLFHKRRWLGLLLIALYDFPFVWNANLLYNWQSYYWTAVLLLCWGVLAWQVFAESRAAQPAGRW
jgi:hypothetical protein